MRKILFDSNKVKTGKIKLFGFNKGKSIIIRYDTILIIKI